MEAKKNSSRAASPSDGFSLIELMVTLVFIGVLLGLASPVYSELRRRAYDAATVSDVVNAATALEGTVQEGDVFLLELVNGPGTYRNLPGPRVSPGTQMLIYRFGSAGRISYYSYGRNSRGSRTYLMYNGSLFTF